MRATTKQPSKALPGDVDALKKIIADQDKLLVHKEQRITILEEFVRLHKLKTFSASTEKSINQQEMFNEAELSVAAEEVLAEQEAEREAQPNTAPAKPKKNQAANPCQIACLAFVSNMQCLMQTIAVIAAANGLKLAKSPANN